MRAALIGVGVLGALPVAAIVAIMAGPVALVLLAVVGFGLVTFVAGNALLAVGFFARSTERRAMKHLNHWRH